MDKEKLIKQIMQEAEADGEPVTREEAEEMAEMEIKAKGIKRYEQKAEKKVERKPREKKVDEEKASIIKALAETLETLGYNPTVVNVDKQIDFGVFTVNLVKHRPPKK